MSSANTRQVGGEHYGLGTLQHWDFTAVTLRNRYMEGRITAYISRWRKKDGIRDLHKALHFVDKLIELHSNATIPRSMAREQEARAGVATMARLRPPSVDHEVHSFCLAVGANDMELRLIHQTSTWAHQGDLRALRAELWAYTNMMEEKAAQVAEGIEHLDAPQENGDGA